MIKPSTHCPTQSTSRAGRPTPDSTNNKHHDGSAVELNRKWVFDRRKCGVSFVRLKEYRRSSAYLRDGGARIKVDFRGVAVGRGEAFGECLPSCGCCRVVRR